MIRYGYNRQVNPPAPFVHVTLDRPSGTKDRAEWPAQLDRAADRTVFPTQAQEALGLAPYAEMAVGGLGGHVSNLTTVLVEVAFRQMQPLVVEALVGLGEPFVLLGRDFLNHFRIVLDGPQLALEIE